MSVCQRCRKQRGAFGRCGCGDQARAWKRQESRTRKTGHNLTSGGHQVANPANRSVKWCSCGCPIRDGKCSSFTCGKPAPS